MRKNFKLDDKIIELNTSSPIVSDEDLKSLCLAGNESDVEKFLYSIKRKLRSVGFDEYFYAITGKQIKKRKTVPFKTLFFVSLALICVLLTTNIFTLVYLIKGTNTADKYVQTAIKCGNLGFDYDAYVHTSPNGDFFHLAKSNCIKNVIVTSVTEAIEEGRSPCTICFPTKNSNTEIVYVTTHTYHRGSCDYLKFNACVPVEEYKAKNFYSPCSDCIESQQYSRLDAIIEARRNQQNN